MKPYMTCGSAENREEFVEADPGECVEFLKSRLETVRNELIRHYLTISLRAGEVPLKDFLARIEKQLIESALFVSYGNQRRASSVLGVKPSCLNEKIKRYGIRNIAPPPTVKSIKHIQKMLNLLSD